MRDTSKPMRVLGVDPGTRRVGIAIADDDSMFAEARTTLAFTSHQDCAKEVARIAESESVSRVVVGLPIGMDGREGLSSKHARTLASAIEQVSGLPVVLWDERMTSRAAHRALGASGVSSRKRKGRVDQIAASLLLDAYLEWWRERGDG